MGNYLTHLNKFLWHPLNISSVQFSHSVVSNSSWPQGLQHARLPFHHQLPEFTQTHVHWVGDAIQPSQPLPLASPPTFNLSQYQGFFKWVSSSHQVAKVLEFQFQHPFNEYSGLISFIIYWLDLPAIQGLSSLLQHHSSKASILQHSAFFIVQLSDPYMTIGLVAISYQAFIYKGTAPSALHRASILIYPLQQYYETGTSIIPILQMRKVRFTDIYYFTQCYTLVSTEEELDSKSRFESLRSHVWPFRGNLILHRKEEQGGKRKKKNTKQETMETGIRLEETAQSTEVESPIPGNHPL